MPNQEWERAEAVKVSLPKTQLFSGWTTDTLKQELPVWVISLARATKRRRTILKELRKAGVLLQTCTSSAARDMFEQHGICSPAGALCSQHSCHCVLPLCQMQQYRAEIEKDRDRAAASLYLGKSSACFVRVGF